MCKMQRDNEVASKVQVATVLPQAITPDQYTVLSIDDAPVHFCAEFMMQV